jgi:hypothetical protein
MATSPKFRFFHEAKEAAKRLNERYPTKRGWHAVSSQPPMTPEQCMPWRDHTQIVKFEDIDPGEDLYA